MIRTDSTGAPLVKGKPKPTKKPQPKPASTKKKG
jgi:hypothetical protein